jgi:hypothetical protein
MKPTAALAGLAAVVALALGAPRLLPALAVERSAAAGLDCRGDERWAIKTVTDTDAGKVNKTATTTTVEALRNNETRPDKVSAKFERIAPQQTMIIEFPDTSCEPQKSSSYATEMGSARAAFVALVRRCIG